MKIAICPGHKPSARGAVNKQYHLTEYDEMCKIVAILKSYLHDFRYSPEIFGLHDNIGLTRKVNAINKGGFDLAFDLHFNADADHLDPDDSDDWRGYGSMVMYYPGSTKRKKQADTMSKAMFDKMEFDDGRNLGGREGWYWGSDVRNGKPTIIDYFLRATNCPAFIPEPGFIDRNRFCEEYLCSKQHDRIANAIAYGIHAVASE